MLSDLWVFVIIIPFLLWSVSIIDRRTLRRVLKRTVLTECHGRVESRAIAPARVEEEWLHSFQFTDPVSVPWLGMEPPVLIRRAIPATPYLFIRMENGSDLMHECAAGAGEYESWGGRHARADRCLHHRNLDDLRLGSEAPVSHASLRARRRQRPGKPGR